MDSLIGSQTAAFPPLLPEDPAEIGRYRLLARLGAGGMGRVYLARSATGHTVALKVIRAEFAEDPEFRRRFRREVAAARAVGGAYTAAVVDADTEGPLPWLATAYLPGPSLAGVVRRSGPLPEHTVRALAAGLGEALGAIHRCGLIHRDLKPSNVLLAVPGPQVIDFGIARAVEGSDLTSTGIVIGTPAYMSPEQAADQVLTPASDVYSLGSVLAFAATGASPHGNAGHGAATLYKVIHEDPDLGDVPPPLRELIGALMSKRPADRPDPRAAARLLAPDGAAALFTRAWLPTEVAGELARHAAVALDLAAPLRAPADAEPGAPADEPAAPPADAAPLVKSAPPPRPRPAVPQSLPRRLLVRTGFLAAVGGAGWLAIRMNAPSAPSPGPSSSPDASPLPAPESGGTPPAPLWHQARDSLATVLVAPADKTVAVLLGTVEALDSTDGTTRWHSGLSPDSSAVVDGSALYVCDGETGETRAFDLTTGQQLEKLVRGEGELLAVDGDVACFRAAASADRKTYRLTGHSFSSSRTWQSEPLDGTVYPSAGTLITNRTGKVVALNELDGSVKWSTATVDAGVQVLAADSGTYFTADPLPDATLTAYDLASGTVHWSTAAPGVSGRITGAGAANGMVYAVLQLDDPYGAGAVFAMRTSDGSPQWLWTSPVRLAAAAPVVVGDKLMVLAAGTDGASVVAVGLADHRTAWVHRSPAEGSATPLGQPNARGLSTDGSAAIFWNNGYITALPA